MSNNFEKFKFPNMFDVNIGSSNSQYHIPDTI